MHPEAIERGAIDVDAESRSLRDGDTSARVFDRNCEESLPDRMLRPIEFQYRLQRIK
jgi:hypothetical protein